MSNQVDMFKYYASQLNLSKPQLEAVTNCFQASFEADEVEPAVTEQPDQTAPSEDRTKDASFTDNTMFTDESMKEALHTDNKLLQKMMNTPNEAAKATRGDVKAMTDAGKSAAGGNYQNVVYKQEEADRIKCWQNFLNKTLGINLDVDGRWGKQTADAYQQYLNSKQKA